MIKQFLLVFVLCLTLAAPVWAAPKLVWDPNPAADVVTGYKVHSGAETGVYGDPIDVGNITEMNLDEVLYPMGGTYYFAVVAYDGSGNDSDISDELAWDRVAAENPTNL